MAKAAKVAPPTDTGLTADQRAAADRVIADNVSTKPADFDITRIPVRFVRFITPIAPEIATAGADRHVAKPVDYFATVDNPHARWHGSTCVLNRMLQEFTIHDARAKRSYQVPMSAVALYEVAG